MNLRRRVAVALVALVTVFVVAQGTVAYLSLEEQEDRMADELVLAEARQLLAYVERGDLDGPRAVDILDRGGDFNAWLVRADGSTVPSPPPAPLRGLPDGPHRLTLDAQVLHVLVTATSAGRLLVTYDAVRSEAQVEQYGLFLIGLGLICIVAAAVMASRLAGIVTAPLERLSARLREWAPDGRSRETTTARSAPAADDESVLLEAFGRVQSRFEQAIAHEREFASNLGHELRTPLAALRTDLEMLDDASALAPAQRERVRRMLASIDAAASALESALSLARRTASSDEAVALARCVDDAWLTLEPAAQAGGLVLNNRVAAGAVLRADRHALLTILRNLLRNAAEHAGPARCTVSGDARALRIEDDGPGIDAAALPHLFERHWRGSRVDLGASRADAADPVEAQRGLGLAIARQVAEVNGWTLTAAPRAGGGLTFVLGFQQA